MQLYACLESIDHFIIETGHKTVIYRASSKEYEHAYKIVQKDFPHVEFKKQSKTPARDFKKLVLESIFSDYFPSPYVTFLVDDDIVKESVDLKECCRYLELYQAYAFYLRLGLHVDICYSENFYQGIPPLLELENGVYLWKINEGKGDWNYPNTVEMTIYRKSEIEPILRALRFTNPNTLEARWASQVDPQWMGLCFKNSKVVNIPLNIVNETWANRNQQSHTPRELLKKFIRGWKLDICPLFGIHNRSAHMEHDFQFIRR